MNQSHTFDVRDELTVRGRIRTDEIAEFTPGNGVSIEGVELEDGVAQVSRLEVDDGKIILDTSGSIRNIDATNDLIIASTNASKMVCLEVGTPATSQLCVKNSEVTLDTGIPLEVDTINESSGGSGVTVDGVLLKDTSVSFDAGVNSLSTIVEASTTSGITNPNDSTNLTGLGSPTLTQSHQVGSMMVIHAKFSISVTASPVTTSFTFDLSTEPSWVQSNGDRALVGHAAVTASGSTSPRVFVPVMWQFVNGPSQQFCIVEWVSVTTGATDVYVQLNYIV